MAAKKSGTAKTTQATKKKTKGTGGAKSTGAAKKKTAGAKKKTDGTKKKADGAKKDGAKKKASAKSAGAKKAASGKQAASEKKPSTEKAAVAKKKSAAKGKFDAADVNLGHIFALRPRVPTSFRPEDLRTAKHLLVEETFENAAAAARAVAEKALELIHEGRSTTKKGSHASKRW